MHTRKAAAKIRQVSGTAKLLGQKNIKAFFLFLCVRRSDGKVTNNHRNIQAYRGQGLLHPSHQKGCAFIWKHTLCHKGYRIISIFDHPITSL